jgi:hypothetical protein
MRLPIGRRAIDGISQSLVEAVRTMAARVRRTTRRLWHSHLDLVTTSVPYATAAAALLGATLGLIPPRDAIAAALSALLAAWASRRGRGDTSGLTL